MGLFKLKVIAAYPCMLIGLFKVISLVWKSSSHFRVFWLSQYISAKYQDTHFTCFCIHVQNHAKIMTFIMYLSAILWEKNLFEWMRNFVQTWFHFDAQMMQNFAQKKLFRAKTRNCCPRESILLWKPYLWRSLFNPWLGAHLKFRSWAWLLLRTQIVRHNTVGSWSWNFSILSWRRLVPNWFVF